jgi:hypothetical protein
MMVEGVPAKASPGALPEGGVLPGEAPPPQGLLAVPSQGDQPAQETLIAPPLDEQALQQTGATPLAMAPPAEPQEEEPLAASTTEEPGERGARLMPAALLARVGWRVAEVGLGLLLVGLIVAIAWGRRTR